MNYFCLLIAVLNIYICKWEKEKMILFKRL